MLLGSYYYSLQAKGRLAIPAAFRPQLGDNAIITRGIEPCLYLLPFNIWSNLIKGLGDNPLAGQETRQLRRLLAHSAQPAEFDDQGRILINSNLITWASLEKKVVIAGSIDWVEIWDINTYNQHLEKLEAESEDIAHRLTSNQHET
jgi:MraZ protein